MALGSPKTKKALIGTFELRIGPLNKAGLLTADHSVGIVDQVKLDMQMDSVDLMAGFPQKTVDTAITKFVTGFSATLRESSRRNLNVLLGNGLFDYDAANLDVFGTVDTTSALAVGATSLTMDISFEGVLAVGDTVVIYDVANPGNVSIARVSAFTAKNGVTPASVTLSATTPLVAPTGAANSFAAGASVRLYKAQTIAGGAITGVPNYFAAQLIRQDRGTGRPMGFNFWKSAISSGISLSASVTEFASMDMQLKALEPAATEYAAGGVLAHLTDVIPSNPVFQVFDVPDSAAA
jgi:hypothetical protein